MPSEFSPTVNWEEPVKVAVRAAQKVMGNESEYDYNDDILVTGAELIRTRLK